MPRIESKLLVHLHRGLWPRPCLYFHYFHSLPSSLSSICTGLALPFTYVQFIPAFGFLCQLLLCLQSPFWKHTLFSFWFLNIKLNVTFSDLLFRPSNLELSLGHSLPCHCFSFLYIHSFLCLLICCYCRQFCLTLMIIHGLESQRSFSLVCLGES